MSLQTPTEELREVALAIEPYLAAREDVVEAGVPNEAMRLLRDLRLALARFEDDTEVGYAFESAKIMADIDAKIAAARRAKNWLQRGQHGGLS